VGHPGELGDLGLHHRLGEDPNAPRRKSTSPSAVALRRVSSTAIPSSAVVVFLRVVGSYRTARE